jgi:acetyl esterase/lipase
MKRKLISALFCFAFAFICAVKLSKSLKWFKSLMITLSVADDTNFTYAKRNYRVVHKKIYYFFKGEKIGVKIFRSYSNKKSPAILVAHGLAPDGYDDTRLVSFAQKLAMTGTTVFLPDFTLMKQIRIKPLTAIKMRFLFNKMRSLKRTDKNKCSVFAISYAGGPVSLAFSKSPYNKQVSSIYYLGSYFDLKQALLFGLSGRSYYLKCEVHTIPSVWARWYYLISNLEYVKDKKSRSVLKKIAEIKRIDPFYNTAKLEKELTGDAAKLLELIKEKDYQKLKKLVENQSIEFRKTLDIMSPKNCTQGLKEIKIFIIHAAEDPLVSYTESFHFAHALKKAGASPSFILLSSLSHVNIIKKPFTLMNILKFYLPEIVKMTNIIYTLRG